MFVFLIMVMGQVVRLTFYRFDLEINAGKRSVPVLSFEKIDILCQNVTENLILSPV